jgi:hypothetical protein
VRLSVLIAGLAVRERVVDGGGGSELRSRYTGGVKPVI